MNETEEGGTIKNTRKKMAEKGRREKNSKFYRKRLKRNIRAKLENKKKFGHGKTVQTVLG